MFADGRFPLRGAVDVTGAGNEGLQRLNAIGHAIEGARDGSSLPPLAAALLPRTGLDRPSDRGGSGHTDRRERHGVAFAVVGVDAHLRHRGLARRCGSPAAALGLLTL